MATSKDTNLTDHFFICDFISEYSLSKPNKIALVIDGKEYSYRELEQFINTCCTLLAKNELSLDKPIAMLMDRSIEMVVVYLAIMKMGGMVVPISQDDPTDRVKLILQDANVKIIVSNLDDDLKLFRNFNIIFININELSQENADVDPKATRGHLKEEDTTLIIYTSGSSGRPKGVMVTHSNLNHYVKSLNQCFKISDDDVYLCRGSFALIVFARQLLMPLASGITTILTTSSESADPIRVAKLIHNNKVTIFDHVPSFWKHFYELIRTNATIMDEYDFSHLRIIASGGEIVGPNIIMFWKSFFGLDKQYYNLYGQTEGTGVVTIENLNDLVEGESTPITIGEAINDMEVYLLNPDLSKVHTGEMGEIHISGKGVSKGYYNRPIVTKNCFIDNPNPPKDADGTQHAKLYKTGDMGKLLENGKIEFVGRKDLQVNLMGRRIELPEIEKHLSTYPGVLGVCVVHKKIKSKELLIAYFVGEKNFTPNYNLIKRHLRKKLPYYMMPNHFFLINKFPLTSSGKINRQSLIQFDPPIELNNQSPPKNKHQEIVCNIWKELFNHQEIGIHDNFFSLGGNSLLGVQMIAAIEKEFKRKVSIEALYNFSTIEQLCSQLFQESPNVEKIQSNYLNRDELKKMATIVFSSGLARLKQNSLILKANENRNTPPLFWCFNAPGEEMAALLQFLNPKQPLYGLMSSVELDNSLETRKNVAYHYVDEIQKFYPEGPLILGGNCRGAKVMIEMINKFQELGRSITHVSLMEYFDPILYDFQGKLLLLFGKYSHLKRHELLNWNEPGWEKPFVKHPNVYWLPAKHAAFFEGESIKVLTNRLQDHLFK